MMTIDLMGNTVYSLEDLKSRAMTRLAAQGLGLAERLANVERMVYAHAGAYLPTAEVQAQIAAIGQMLIAEESVYEQEKADTILLAAAIAYEQAQRRLALPVVDGDEVDGAARQAAQTVIDGGNPAVVELVTLRNLSEVQP